MRGCHVRKCFDGMCCPLFLSKAENRISYND